MKTDISSCATSMRVSLIVIGLVFCTTISQAAEPYTLVLGLSKPGEGLLGYCDYAEQQCQSDRPCLTFDKLKARFDCRGFAECVTMMMIEADAILFLADKPGGLFSDEDVRCEPSDDSEPQQGEHTGIELCIVTHCCDLYKKTAWITRNECLIPDPSRPCPLSAARENDRCPSR